MPILFLAGLLFAVLGASRIVYAKQWHAYHPSFWSARAVRWDGIVLLLMGLGMAIAAALRFASDS